MVSRALFLGFSLLSLGVEASELNKSVSHQECGEFILNQADIIATSAQKIQNLQKEMDSGSTTVGLSGSWLDMRWARILSEIETLQNGCVKFVILCQKALARTYNGHKEDPTESLGQLSAHMKFNIDTYETSLGDVRRWATDFVTYGKSLTEIDTELDELHQKWKACQKEDPIFDLKNESFHVQELNFQSERDKCAEFLFTAGMDLRSSQISPF